VSRTTAQILEQLLRFLPDRFRSYSDVRGGGAAGLAEAEALWEELAAAATIGGAEGVILRLRARGFGIYAQGDETDATLRARMRGVEGQVTRPAILDAVNALLAPYTATEAGMLEGKDEGFWDVDFWWDSTIFADQHNAFVLVLPLLGDEVVGASYFDCDDYFDVDFYWGSGVEHAVYASIGALVRRIRAAGIRVWIHIEA
jgi:hypothetical protein